VFLGLSGIGAWARIRGPSGVAPAAYAFVAVPRLLVFDAPVERLAPSPAGPVARTRPFRPPTRRGYSF